MGKYMFKENFNHFQGIIDTTLREGRQFHCGNPTLFTLGEQTKIIERLTQIGVDRIEVSNPASPDIFQELKQLTKIADRPSFLAHVRNRAGDIQAAIDAGVEGVNILSISDEERLKSMGITHEEHLSTLKQCILTAQEAGKEVRVGSEHYFSAKSDDKERAHNVFRLADSLGVARISIPDTLGIAMSWDVVEEVAYVRKMVKADIEVHFHNDLGQATANALSAVKNGANWVDTTILGIGERTGITPLSIFLAGLHVNNPSLVSNYHLEYLTSADQMLANILGIKVPFNMVTNQDNGFAHKAGIHLNAIMRHGPDKYEVIPPNVIGNRRRLILGSVVSGKTNQEQVDAFYNKYG